MPSGTVRSPALDLDRLRAALVDAGRRLGARGLISAGEGNLSIRLPDDRLLVTPSGLRKDELAPADLLIVTIDPATSTLPEPGSQSGGARARSPAGLRPSSDIAIHRAILRARPDAMAVAHAHLPAAMALTLAGEVPDPAILPETALLLPHLPFVPFGAPGSDELAARIAAAFSQGASPGGAPSSLPGAVVLERHGAVAVGSAPPPGPGPRPSDVGPTEARIAALTQAVDRLELVEVLCRTWRDALLLRAAARLTP